MSLQHFTPTLRTIRDWGIKSVALNPTQVVAVIEIGKCDEAMYEEGTNIVMSDGHVYNVTESYLDVVGRLFSAV
jgi:hypothetical protein